MTLKSVPPFSNRIMEQTYNVLIGLWMNNLAENLSLIRSGLDILDVPKRKGEPVICVGGGPSLAKYQHLKMIKKSGWNHPVLSCDRELQNCLKHEILPYAVASVDGNPIIARYYNHHLVKKYAKDIHAAFAVTVHPNVVRAWRGKIYWFVAMLDHVEAEGKADTHSKTFLLHLLTKLKGVISGIGNVGSFLWNFAAELGCSPIILVGYDFSEQVKYKEKAVYWNHFVKMFLQDGKDGETAQDQAAALHQVERNPDFNEYYLVNPIWKRYQVQLAAHIITSKIHTINATGNGCLHTEAVNCDNFEAMSLEKVLETYIKR